MQESDGVYTIDADQIKTRCLIFLSTFQEVLRFHGINTSVCTVLEDHVLDSQYLLKKGSTTMMPAPRPAQHPNTRPRLQDHHPPAGESQLERRVLRLG